jgi:hypothetical protein
MSQTAQAAGFTVIGALIGTFLTYLFQVLRDRASKREAVRAAKLQLIKDVDELYRSSKQIRRILRSRTREDGDDKSFKSGFFENHMDALSKLQLSLEQSRQTIRARTDFFEQLRQRRLLYELGYAESYLNDVVEEFEKRCVTHSNGSYKLTNKCNMLNDFLGPKDPPEPVAKDFKMLTEGRTEKRHDALRSIVKKLKDPRNYEDEPEVDSETITDIAAKENLPGGSEQGKAINRRYRSVADRCLLLALREMRESLLDLPEHHWSVRKLKFPKLQIAGTKSQMEQQQQKKPEPVISSTDNLSAA